MAEDQRPTSPRGPPPLPKPVLLVLDYRLGEWDRIQEHQAFDRVCKQSWRAFWTAIAHVVVLVFVMVFAGLLLAWMFPLRP